MPDANPFADLIPKSSAPPSAPSGVFDDLVPKKEAAPEHPFADLVPEKNREGFLARTGRYETDALKGIGEDVAGAFKGFKPDNPGDSTARRVIERIGQYGAPVMAPINAAMSPLSSTASAAVEPATSKLLPKDASQAKKDAVAQAVGGTVANVGTMLAPGVRPARIAEAANMSSLEREAFVNQNLPLPQSSTPSTIPQRRPSSIRDIINSGGSPVYHDSSADGVMGIIQSGGIEPRSATGIDKAIRSDVSVYASRDFNNYSRKADSPYRMIIDQNDVEHKSKPVDNTGERAESEEVYSKKVPLSAVKTLAINDDNPAIQKDIKNGKYQQVIDAAEKAGIRVEHYGAGFLADNGGGSLHSEDIGQPQPTVAPKEPKPAYQSKIFSPDQPLASTEPASTVKGVADKLYQQQNGVRADYKEFANWAKPFKGIPKQFWQKALDHLDDPKGVPLSPQEKIIFDRSIGTMKEEIDANRAKIKAAGFNPNQFEEESGSLGGAIRVRKGMNTPLDRATGTKTAARPPEAGKSLSRSAGTFKGRNMMAVTQDGQRTVVHVDPDGVVHDAANPENTLGAVDETGKFNGKGQLGEATRKEIEAATGGKIQYHDNAFGVYGTTLLQTRRALRSVQALQDIKKSPDFNLIARAPYSKGEIPKGWREIPDSPEFRGYRFEPRYAEEIEDFLKGSKFDAGNLNKLDRLNRFTLNTMFWANPYHAFNMTNAFTVTKGLGGLVRDLPGTTMDLLKSLKSVATRDKFNMADARAGVPMRGLDTAGEDFNKMLLNVMGVKMRQSPQSFAQFAKEYGFNKPADFYSYVSRLSHKATFSWQDVLQQTLERGLMRKGLSRPEATEQIAKTFMNYRTPSRVGDQRWIGQALQGQAWLNFPKYAYGRLNGMYNILKGSAKLDPHSLDQLITVGVLYEFGQHVINPWLQQVTGNPNAASSEFGYEDFPALAADTAEGKRTLGQDFQSLFSPGYATQAFNLAQGVIPFTGKPISQPGESPKEVGFDYLNQFANRFRPVQQANQLARGQISPEDLWLEQMGVRFPTDPQTLKSVQRNLKTREKYDNPTQNLFDSVAP